MSKTAVGLEIEWKQVKELLEKRKFLVFPNRVGFGEKYAVWPEGQGVESFLDLAQSLDVRLIYFSKAEFSFGDIKELVAEFYSDDLEDEEIASAETNRIEEMTKPFLSKISMFMVQWVYQGVVHVFFRTADWYEALEVDLEEHHVDVEEQNERQFKHKQSELQKIAQSLANDSNFQKAHNSDMRFIVAQKLYPGFDEDEVAELAYLAWQVYENEIMPKKEQELADEARKSLAEGQSLTHTASKLGMTSGRLERLLARYPANEDKN